MTFTKERLEEIAEDGFLKHGESKELARIALAGMEAEPFAYYRRGVNENGIAGAIEYLSKRERDLQPLSLKGGEYKWNEIPLYAAPQPLTDADRQELQEYRNAEFMPKNLDRALTIMGVSLPESKEEFNLQAERWMQRLIDRVIRWESELSPQSGAVKDGWVMVPVEPTPEMRDAYHNAREEYEEMDGLYSPDHQWKAMIAAAPQQEAVPSALENGMTRYSGAMQKLADGGD